MPRVKLSPDERDKIQEAVKAAESNTSGEIATAFIDESYNYAIYELTFAVFCGFIYFLTVAFFTHPIEKFLQNYFWDYDSQYLVMFFGFSTFLVIALFYLLANIPIIDRLVVSRTVMLKKVRQRALRHFMESGVYATRDRTGILIFISNLEHRVELLADQGINEKIPQEKWDDIVKHIITGIHLDQMVPHLCDAIAQCGELLARHFPIKADDTNELNDAIQVLKK